MAVVPVKMSQLSTLTMSREGVSFARGGTVVDLDGAPIDLSAWASLTVEPYASGNYGGIAPLGTVTGNADGTFDVTATAAQAQTMQLAGYNYLLRGVHVAGDATQSLGKGSIQISEGAQLI